MKIKIMVWGRALMVALAVCLIGLSAPSYAAAEDGQRFAASADLDGRLLKDLDDHAYPNLYLEGESVHVLCQAPGPVAYGSNVWDYTEKGSVHAWVVDRYVRTGYDGFSPDLTRCAESPPKNEVSEKVDYVTIRFVEQDTPEPPCDWNCSLMKKVERFGIGAIKAGADAKQGANCIAEGLGISRNYGCTLSDAAHTIAPIFQSCVKGVLGNQIAEAFLKRATASIPSAAYWCVATAAGELGFSIEGVN